MHSCYQLLLRINLYKIKFFLRVRKEEEEGKGRTREVFSTSISWWKQQLPSNYEF